MLRVTGRERIGVDGASSGVGVVSCAGGLVDPAPIGSTSGFKMPKLSQSSIVNRMRISSTEFLGLNRFANSRVQNQEIADRIIDRDIERNAPHATYLS